MFELLGAAPRALGISGLGVQGLGLRIQDLGLEGRASATHDP